MCMRMRMLQFMRVHVCHVHWSVTLLPSCACDHQATFGLPLAQQQQSLMGWSASTKTPLTGFRLQCCSCTNGIPSNKVGFTSTFLSISIVSAPMCPNLDHAERRFTSPRICTDTLLPICLHLHTHKHTMHVGMHGKRAHKHIQVWTQYSTAMCCLTA